MLGGEFPDTLQYVRVPAISNSDCNEAYGAGSITSAMICAGFPEGGKDACQGKLNFVLETFKASSKDYCGPFLVSGPSPSAALANDFFRGEKELPFSKF